eukprot:2186480-Rhodomonas_salina.1
METRVRRRMRMCLSLVALSALRFGSMLDPLCLWPSMFDVLCLSPSACLILFAYVQACLFMSEAAVRACVGLERVLVWSVCWSRACVGTLGRVRVRMLVIGCAW